MENKEKKKEKTKLSKRQKQVIIITASLIAFLAIVLTAAICLKENNLPSLNLLRKVNRIFKNNSVNFERCSRNTKRAKKDKFFRPKVLN